MRLRAIDFRFRADTHPPEYLPNHRPNTSKRGARSRTVEQCLTRDEIGQRTLSCPDRIIRVHKPLLHSATMTTMTLAIGLLLENGSVSIELEIVIQISANRITPLLAVVAAIMPIDFSVSWGASGFSPAAGDFSRDMGVSPHIAILGLSMYVLGLAFGPMSLAPLSEYYGRKPVYIVSYGIFLLLLLGTTYVESLGPFLILRFFSGYFSSTTISNFGGTIADLFYHHDTGPAMSWFLWAATGGSPTGFVLFSFIAHGRSWHDVFRIMFYICFTFWIILVVALYALGETRHSVILFRRARALRKATGEERLDVPEAMKQRGVKQLFGTALTRPFRFLASEAIVQFGALYNGFLYGLSFLFNGAFHLIFGPDGYGFDTIGVGICFLGIVIGITVGLVTNTFQERNYQRRVAEAGNRDVPEARVGFSKAAAIMLPISLLVFALTATPSIHPIVPVLASGFWGCKSIPQTLYRA